MLSFGPTQFPVDNTCLYNDVIVLTQIALLLIFGWGGGGWVGGLVLKLSSSI